MKQVVLIVAAVCVVALIWLSAISQREDSGDRGAEAPLDSSDPREPDALAREVAPSPPGGGAGIDPGEANMTSIYEDDPLPALPGAEREESISRTSTSERYEAIKRRVEAEHAAGRGAEPSRAPADEAQEDTRPSHQATQTRAAELALQLELIPAEQLEMRVERAVPEGSLPPAEIEPAREAAREELLRDELILDYLTDQSLPEGASDAERRRTRDLGRTLLSGQSQEYKDAMALKALEAQGAAP